MGSSHGQRCGRSIFQGRFSVFAEDGSSGGAGHGDPDGCWLIAMRYVGAPTSAERPLRPGHTRQTCRPARAPTARRAHRGDPPRAVGRRVEAEVFELRDDGLVALGLGAGGLPCRAGCAPGLLERLADRPSDIQGDAGTISVQLHSQPTSFRIGVGESKNSSAQTNANLVRSVAAKLMNAAKPPALPATPASSR
jgi:hypothetical protein